MLSFFSLYSVATLPALAAHLRATRGSLYASIPSNSGTVSPALLKRLARMRFVEICGEHIYLTDAGIKAATLS